MFVGRLTARPLPQLSLGASGTHDGPDSLRWGVDASVRGTAYGANVEFAPQRVRLLVEFSRRVTGRQQLHSDAYIAQLQVIF
jgi:hypothetical protein